MSPSKGRNDKGKAKAKKTAKPASSASKTKRAAAGAKRRTAAKPAAKPKKAKQASARATKATSRGAAVKTKPAAAAPKKPAIEKSPLRPVEVTASGARVLDVLNVKRQTVGRAELTGALFASEPNPALLHEAVIMQLASRRQGTADTKERGEVSGTGRKPWKQKGTGRARSGSVRSPLWRKGGIVFGPTPRDYGYAFPRKKGRAALAGAMSAKVAQNGVVVLDQLALAEPKTKLMAGVLDTLGLDGRVLIVHRDDNGWIQRASANLGRVTVLDVSGLNVYDVLANQHIVLMQSDLGRLAEAWS
ncbi:MAG: 50S ribosomal protein L4 [Nitrospirota bacterium]